MSRLQSAWVTLLAVGVLAAQPAPMARTAAGGSAHRSCASCHRGHRGVAGSAGLVSGQGKVKAGRSLAAPNGDAACLACHGGPTLQASVHPTAAPTLEAGTQVASSHLAGRGGGGDSFRRVVRQGSRTVTLTLSCQGCHDPHGREKGRLRSVAFDSRGQLLERRPQSAADLCFGCHAGPDAVRLSSGATDLGDLFTRSGGSAHTLGVTASSRPDLPSLRTSLFTGRLDCTSCHDNSDPAGPRGPHTSGQPALLKAAYGRERDLGRLGERANDLCYLCHDRQSILSNQSFSLHAQHLQGFTQGGSGSPRRQASGLAEAQAMMGIRSPRDLRPGRAGAFQPGYGEPTVCATCHASHGSPRQDSLVAFDRTVVVAGTAGTVAFQRAGLGHGTCTLSCHGYDHIQARY